MNRGTDLASIYNARKAEGSPGHRNGRASQGVIDYLVPAEQVQRIGLVHAVTDDFASLTPRIPDIMASDAYTLRRIGLE